MGMDDFPFRRSSGNRFEEVRVKTMETDQTALSKCQTVERLLNLISSLTQGVRKGHPYSFVVF